MCLVELICGLVHACLVAVFRVAEFCLGEGFLSQLSLVTGASP